MIKTSSRVWILAAAITWALGGNGCRRDEDRGELHARQVALEREVKGLRASVEKLERGEPILPEEAVIVSISEEVVQDMISAQLPTAVELESYTVTLRGVKATFRGSPAVTLDGSIVHKDHPDYSGEVSAIGALDSIQVETTTGTLRATVAVDHVDLLQMGGLEAILPGGTIDELALRVRKRLAGRIPELQIPVKLEQAVDLPAVTQGPVRLQAASMPLAVSVADIMAGQGVLWIAINVVPGNLVKTPAASSPTSSAVRAPKEGQR